MGAFFFAGLALVFLAVTALKDGAPVEKAIVVLLISVICILLEICLHLRKIAKKT